MKKTLRQKQSDFAFMISDLIWYAYLEGYELTFGDAYRDPRCPYGIKNGKHSKRLAVDFNLFKNGKYLRSTRSHKFLGEYWEELGGTWGGRFKKPDGNHYEY
jgi:hypothetical protein